MTHSNATVAKYSYQFYKEAKLNFFACVNNTGTANNLKDCYIMNILGKARDLNLSFALDVYPNEKGYVLDWSFCMDNSEPTLRPLIKDCYSRIVLRNLTADEEKEMNDVKSRELTNN